MSVLGPGDRPPTKTGSRGDGADTHKTVPVKAHTRKVRVKAPAGDVASSGGNYGIPEAKKGATTPRVQRNTRAVYAAQPVKQRQRILAHATGPIARTVHDVHEQRRQRAEEIAHSQAAHDIMTAADKKAADAYNAAHEVIHKPKGVKGPAALFATNPATLAAAGFKTEGKLDKALKLPTQVVANAFPDAAELAVTTPTSAAKLVSTAVHDPKKVPGMLADPYVNLAKHPAWAIKHPVSTALMLSPAARLPGRAVGRVARVAGKQTLERPSATLPGTTLKETRTGSRDVAVRAVQARKDAKAGAPTMSDKQVQHRVDEFYDFGKQHTSRVEAAAARQAKERALPKDEAALHVEGARGGAATQVQKRFAQEFGSPYDLTPDGVLLKPKHATEGKLHDSKANADAIAKRVPFDATVMKVGDTQHAVVPTVAFNRMYGRGGQVHVGSSPATMAKVMRRSRHAFTQAVLPLSLKWLGGQVAEAGVRSVVSGAGPMDLLRVHKVVKEMNKAKPGAGDEMLMRISGGQFGLTGTAREFAQGKSLAEEFSGTSLARPAAAATKAGNVLPAKAARAGFAKYTAAVLDGINGAIEGTARKAMAGQALKNSPLLERHVVGLTDKAIQDAAQGLRGTDAQVQLARTVDRMYGKYQKFSPDKRSLLLHWTPFLPWYLNVATFLGKVLPVDHPAQAALVADTSAATEEWRKKAGLSLRAPHVPDFLLGSAPASKGRVTRIAHYTPFGIGSDVAGSTAALTLPQFLGPIKNAAGVDWKWQREKRPGYSGQEFTQAERVARALMTILEEQVPGVSQAGRISGLTPRYVDKKDVPSVLQGKSIPEALKAELPFMPTAGATGPVSSGPAVRIKPVKVKPIRVKPIRVR